MDVPGPFESADDDTHSQMMRATYDALREHGYAELTIQRIGDEFPKSKSLIYQHYDGKDELLVEFLAFMLDHFESGFPEERALDPEERLRELLDHALPTEESAEQRSFSRAMTALRGHAPYDEAFDDHFAATEAVFKARVADIVRDGVAAGTFDDADPEAVAEFVVTAIQGTTFRRSTASDAIDVAAVRREVDAYLEWRLGFEADE